MSNIDDMGLWAKLTSVGVWVLLVLFVLSGALGGLLYLVREIFMK